MTDEIISARLRLSSYEMSDAEELFACITPAITRFMSWEPPQNFDDFKARRASQSEEDDPNDFSFVIRLLLTGECLGAAALQRATSSTAEVGLWLKERSHGLGYGKEVIASVVRWGANHLDIDRFIYPVAEQNIASRRLVESLGGITIGKQSSLKYSSILYCIPKSIID